MPTVVFVEPGGRRRPVAAEIGETAMQAAIRSSDPADFPEVHSFVQRQQRGELRPPADIAAAILRILALPRLVPGSLHLAADHLA